MMKESIDASERILKGLPNRLKSPSDENWLMKTLADKIWEPIIRKLEEI